MSWSWLLRILLASNFAIIVESVRATDELDSGFVVTEETHGGYHRYEFTTTTTMAPETNFNLVHWGCYEYWSGNGEYFNSDTYDYSFQANISVLSCVLECETRYDPPYQVAMIKGNVCVCTTWEFFSRSRIQDDYCNFECPSEKDLPCGGNLAISVYCNPTKDPKCEGNTDSVGSIPDYPPSGLVVMGANVEYMALGCGKCSEINSAGVAACSKANAIMPAQDYFPLNSPAACVLNCRRNLTHLETDPILPVSAVGWWFDGHDKYPICVCHDKMILQETGPFVPVVPETCDSACPGDPAVACGNTTQFVVFNFYCTYGRTDDGNCTLGSDAPESPEPYPGFETTGETDMTVTTTAAPATTTETTTTVAPSTATTTDPTTTKEATTIETTTLPVETTEGRTTDRVATSTVGLVENSTMSVSTTSVKPVEHTTTITTATTITTTVTTTTTTPGACTPKCQSVDHYGHEWVACAGTVKSRPCHSKSGTARWECLADGTFATESPDHSNCSSPWFDQVYNELNNLTKNGTLPPEKSKELLGRVENLLKRPNDVPYYGHEIANISQLMWFVVGNTSRKSCEGQRRVIESAMKIPGLLLENKAAWKDIHNETERGQVGYDLLVNIERTIFTLTDVYNEKQGILNFPVLPSSKFLASFGTGSVHPSDQDDLVFPNPSVDMNSFIKLSKGWEGAHEDPAFVGLSIHPELVERIMSPHLNMITKQKGSERADKIINGKIISLTLNTNDKRTAFAKDSELLAQVHFQHEVEAYGEESLDIPRKLHPGESPKAVGGTGVCVYWSPTKKLWATDGCKLYPISPHKTVCQCDHLTSFALIMDVHNYVGKEFGLEVLTLLLCPISVVSLVLCIVIFSSITTMHSQRTTITKHLCACLLIGIIMILFVADRNYFHLPDGVCTVVGIGTHYIYMAAFVWMGIEGLHLYKMVVCVFDSGRSPTSLYRITAYGIPVIIVGTTCVVGFSRDDKPYGSDLYCWLNGPYHWSFIGPAAIIVMVNTVVLCLALRTAHQMNPSSAHVISRKRSYKTWIRGSFSITILLGITWLPGFFLLTSSTLIARASAYIFVILNASQGLFLFVYHCLLNDKVRAFAGRRISLPFWLAPSLSPAGSSKETTQSQNENQLHRKWTMFTVRLGEQGARRSKNLQSFFSNNNNDISVVGRGDLKQDEGSWSFFPRAEQQHRRARPSVHFGSQDGRDVCMEKSIRGRGQTFSNRSSSSASSNNTLVGGARR